jgi:hypothetical protein
MPMYRCIKKSYVGGRIREVGDTLEMDTDDPGSAWVPVDADEQAGEQAITDAQGLFGPAVPELPKGKKPKAA